MKAILMSIKPKYVSMILNKTKTIEVRKHFPKDYVGWVYIYCCKQRKNEIGCHINYEKVDGKVVARFWCDKVEGINRYCTGRGISYKTETLNDIELCDKSCLDLIEIDHYLYFKKGYAIHITKLETFDKPKEIREFKYYKKFSEIDYMLPIPKKETCERLVALTRAPQSWQFIEV